MEANNYNMYALYMHEYHTDVLEDLVSSICPDERERIETLKRLKQFDNEIALLFMRHCRDKQKIINEGEEREKLVFFLENSLDCLIQLYTQCESALDMGELSSDVILYGRNNRHIKSSPFNDEFQVRLREVVEDIVDDRLESNKVGNKKLVRAIVKNVVAKFKELSLKSK